MDLGTGASTATSCCTADNARPDPSCMQNGMNAALVDKGALQARFVNMYDPLYDRPYIKYELNTGRYLDEELCAVLEDDRRANTKHHLQTDKVQKMYMLTMIEHAGITRA